MSTHQTQTLTVTIDAPVWEVVDDLADPANHAQWATEFFAGPARPHDAGVVEVSVPMMGGPVLMRVDADRSRGLVDLYLAPVGAPFGDPIPVRVVPNGTGADVLWTLSRPEQVPDSAWAAGLDAMERELEALVARFPRTAEGHRVGESGSAS